jgi:hypothetical protein
VRLLERIAERCPGRWHAGLLPGLLPSEHCDSVLTYEAFSRSQGKDTLVVIDHASCWAANLEKYIIPALRCRPQDGARLRFLLIDRDAKESYGWYWALRTAAEYDVRWFPRSPLHLRDLRDFESGDGSERDALLVAALDRLSVLTGKPLLDVNEAVLALKTGAARDHLGDPLVLLMAATLAYARSNLAPLTWRRIDLAEALAAHEISRVRLLAKSHSVSEFRLLHLTAYTTLVGGLTAADLRAVCKEEKQSSTDDEITLARVLSESVLPSDDEYLAVVPMVPDVVAEVFVEMVLSDPLQLATETILRAFSRAPVSVVRTLVRIVQDLSPIGGSLRFEDRQVRILGWLGEVLQESADALTDEDLWKIHSDLPKCSVAMTELTRTFFRIILEIPDIPSWLNARALQAHAACNAILGCCEEAVLEATAAVEAYHKIAAEGEEGAFLPELAWSLVTHAQALLAAGDAQGALRSTSTAVDLCREVESKRGEFLHALANALIVHAEALIANDRLMKATVALEEG